MDCEQAVALISARLDQEIQPSERSQLDLHLRECGACRATADAFALQHQELHGAFEPRRRAAAAVADRVNARIPAARARIQDRPPGDTGSSERRSWWAASPPVRRRCCWRNGGSGQRRIPSRRVHSSPCQPACNFRRREN